MFTGALGNTYSADSAIVRIWASVIVLTFSWTSILPRNISNRPKHSHLPLRSPRICLPSFLLPLFNHLSFSFLYRFPVSASCFHFAFKVSFLSFEKGPVMLFVSFLCPLFTFPALLILSLAPPVLVELSLCRLLPSTLASLMHTLLVLSFPRTF